MFSGQVQEVFNLNDNKTRFFFKEKKKQFNKEFYFIQNTVNCYLRLDTRFYDKLWSSQSLPFEVSHCTTALAALYSSNLQPFIEMHIKGWISTDM